MMRSSVAARRARLARAFALVVALAGVFGGRARPARAEESAPIAVGEGESEKKVYVIANGKQDLFRDIASELRCPTCTGLSVLESDAKFSTQIKDIVKEQVEAGKSKDEVLQYFTERYGPWILRAPPKTGFNAIVWVLPSAALLLGPLLVWLLVWRRRPAAPVVAVRSVEEIIREMDERLAALRAGGSRKGSAS
jgi:cytochrome c-type biogenesis protein CcmH/NrfF